MYVIKDVTTGHVYKEPSFSTYEEGKSYMDRYYEGSWYQLWYDDSDHAHDLVEA